jgi:hypothetical protein
MEERGIMADSSTATGGKTESPPDNETVVCLLGELKIDEERVSVGVVSGKDTLVQLDKPALLGDALTVGSWLNDSWGTKVDALVIKKPDNDGKVGSQKDVKPEDIKKHLKELNYPDQVVNLLAELFRAQIVITDLYVHLWKEPRNGTDFDRKAFKFGIAVNFANLQNKNGLNLFGDIYLQNVKLGILNAPKDYDFEAKKLVLPPLRLLNYEEAQKEALKEEGGGAGQEGGDSSPPPKET